MTDARVSIDSVLSAFGLVASVTRPNATAINTRVMWVSAGAEFVPAGMDLQAAVSRRVLVIPKSSVPTLPINTAVSVPEADGEAARSFKVDAIERVEYDHFRAVMVLA